MAGVDVTPAGADVTFTDVDIMGADVIKEVVDEVVVVG